MNFGKNMLKKYNVTQIPVRPLLMFFIDKISKILAASMFLTLKLIKIKILIRMKMENSKKWWQSIKHQAILELIVNSWKLFSRTDQHLQQSRGWSLLEGWRMRTHWQLHPSLVSPQMQVRIRRDLGLGLWRLVRSDHAYRESRSSLQTFQEVSTNSSTGQSVEPLEPLASRRVEQRASGVVVDLVSNVEEGGAALVGRKSRGNSHPAWNFRRNFVVQISWRIGGKIWDQHDDRSRCGGWIVAHCQVISRIQINFFLSVDLLVSK